MNDVFCRSLVRSAALAAAAVLVGVAVGCNAASGPVVEMHPGLAAEQLVPALEEIAETGEYRDVWMDLTVGLEKAGHMQEAADVQSFQQAEGPEAVKALAGRIARQLKAKG